MRELAQHRFALFPSVNPQWRPNPHAELRTSALIVKTYGNDRYGFPKPTCSDPREIHTAPIEWQQLGIFP